MLKKLFLSLGIVLFFIAWSNSPYENTPVCTAQNNQELPCLASDGFGGAVIAWQDYRGGNYDIYAQRLDSIGTRQWKVDGIGICTAAGDQKNVQVVSDGSGGAIIVWQDKRDGSDYDIYAQRVNGAGQIIWTAGGAAICTAAGDQENPRLIADGSGGTIIAWQDKRSGSDWDIYARRIGANGASQWAANGTAVCTASGDQDQHRLASDGSGGALITWRDGRGSKTAIYAQRISGSGSSQWNTDGIVVCEKSYHLHDPQVTALGSGHTVVTWVEDYVYSSYYYYRYYYIYAQKLDSSGSALWYPEGAYVTYQYHYAPSHLQIIPDGGGGVMVGWIAHYCSSQTSVKVKSLDSSGYYRWDRTLDWGDNQHSIQIVSDGSGGVIVTWMDDRYNRTSTDIYAQRLDSSGMNQWTSYGGISVSTRGSQQSGLATISDDAGGIIATWYDGNIYAQNVCSRGGIGDCVYPVANINDWRFGGIVPADIEFDGSGSMDPDGYIANWYWNFGDGKTGSAAKVTHNYPQVGTYWVNLRVRDNNGRWSPEAKAMVKTFALDDLEAEIELSSPKIKANGKGLVQVNAVCKEKQTDPGHEERPIPVNMGMTIFTTTGTWADDLVFGGGIYSRTLASGPPGSAVVQAVLKGKVLGTAEIEFTWPKPPVNLKVELKENRSLFRGEYYAYLSWAANPDEVFTVEKYRIYRSINGGSMELAAEVAAGTLKYVDQHLPLGSQYAYALSTVDIEGDESALSGTVAATR